MNFIQLKEIISFFDQSNLNEFKLKDSDFELYLNKNCTLGVPKKKKEKKSSKIESENFHEQNTYNLMQHKEKEIVSPLVGIVYLQPAPKKPAFKKVGDSINKGEVICIVEAMKVMNEITSDISGEITKVLVKNEELVEFNQPLFCIKEVQK